MNWITFSLILLTAILFCSTMFFRERAINLYNNIDESNQYIKDDLEKENNNFDLSNYIKNKVIDSKLEFENYWRMCSKILVRPVLYDDGILKYIEYYSTCKK